MKPLQVDRDERTVAVVNASYRWSYHTLSFGLLAIAAIRSFIRHEAVWDLVGLVVLSGFVTAVYQHSQHVLYRRWVVVVIVSCMAAGLVGVVIAALRSAR